MKIAIMQPYFFPYIGYFQLINSVDKFVLYDDVNYIKQGWINRNRIISNMEGSYFTLQLQGASSYKNINEIQTGENKNKLARTIRQVYCKTKYFVSVFPMVESILLYSESNLSLYLENSVRKLCHILCIPTEIFLSSSIKKDNSLKGIEKVISICKLFNAQEYINSIGGEILYKKE
ncbi:MAG: WbqC family protein, partial [Candidatus Parcubacteria bacterium]|nr:WbqC family protein [Candidatus Parcubacteria bacterium]